MIRTDVSRFLFYAISIIGGLSLSFSFGIAAFQYVLARRDVVMLISYESTCAHGRDALAAICDRLEIPEEGMLDAAALLFRTPSPRQVDDPGLDPELRDRAEELHKALIAR